jgi:menaquinone-dependent protoporphyrinogen oxidase
MKTLIAFATKTGYTSECAEKISKLLDGESDRINLAAKPPRIDLDGYDRVIIGTPIRADRIQTAVKKFCQTYLPQLLDKKVGLFLSCLTPPEKAERYFSADFPPALVTHARAKGFVGAAVNYDRMNPIERFIMKKITKRGDSFSVPNDQGLTAFARAMK